MKKVPNSLKDFLSVTNVEDVCLNTIIGLSMIPNTDMATAKQATIKAALSPLLKVPFIMTCVTEVKLAETPNGIKKAQSCL